MNQEPTQWLNDYISITMSNKFHALKVSAIKKETEDCVSVSFEIPVELKDEFKYQAGQYLTLKFLINGKEERRAYSMSSAPMESHLTVSVKRLKGGLISNHINDNVKVGDVIEVMTPEGRFVPNLNVDHFKTYYLVGAGSGITPLMSILKSILEEEPKSMVHLLYGNRSESSIIFKAELDNLKERYEGQLTITHILSQPLTTPASGLRKLFSKPTVAWPGLIGRIDLKVIKKWLDEKPKAGTSSLYLICGPGEMIQSSTNALSSLGVEEKSIMVEYFTSSSEEKKKDSPIIKGGASLKARVDGKIYEVNVPEGKTILDVLIEAKADPPYSCTSGSCSTCMAKKTSGSVSMEVCHALDEDEIEEGYILTCQAYPTSREVEVNFDV